MEFKYILGRGYNKYLSREEEEEVVKETKLEVDEKVGPVRSAAIVLLGVPLWQILLNQSGTLTIVYIEVTLPAKPPTS